MRRKLIAGVAAMSLATAIVYAVTTIADAEPPGPPDPAAEVPDSRTLPGKPTLSGRVLDSAGQPLAKAWIVVVAWPSQEALQAIPDGAEVPVEVVAKTRADKEGRFVLRPGKLNALRKFASRNGDINFDLRTVGAPSLVTYSFGRSLHADNGRYLLTLPGEDAREVARTNPNGDVVSEEVVDLSATASPQPGEHAEAGVVVDKEDPPVHTCGYPITVKTYEPTWELVGALYSTVSTGYSATFTYKNGASSSLGVGFSLSGLFGSFKQNGTWSATSTVTQIYPAFSGAGGRYYDTMFRYRLYKWNCAEYRFVACQTGYCPVWTTWTEYHSKPYSFAGGTRVRSVSSTTANYCLSQAAGVTVIVDKSTAVEFSNGGALASTIGIDLSSRTGYSSSASMTFKFTAARRLCGSNGFYGATPKKLQVAA